MSDQKNTITLNGKHYDAVTGVLVESAQRVQQVVGNVVQAAQQATHPAKTSHHRTPGRLAHIAPHKPQHTQTLMRQVVPKPKPSAPKPSNSAKLHLPTSSERLARATAVPKSTLVSKFRTISSAASSNPSHAQKPVNLSVKAAPAEHINHALAPVAAISFTEAFLTNALSHATSHEQTLPKSAQGRSKRMGMSAKVFNVSAAVAVVIVLTGFIAYQNTAYVSLRIASAKAGISGSLPSYQPAGFALNRSISSQPGRIVINFHSNSDSRNFHITQAASDWDSQTLLDSYVTGVSKDYQTISEPNGQIVYLYGNSGATWVNGGVWYTVEGNSSLSNTQLLKLANSL